MDDAYQTLALPYKSPTVAAVHRSIRKSRRGLQLGRGVATLLCREFRGSFIRDSSEPAHHAGLAETEEGTGFLHRSFETAGVLFMSSVLKARVVKTLAAVVAAAALTGLSSAASAQTLIEFLWGGEPEYGGGKRQVVKFNPQYTPGQIIVSFGDRRLYHITKPGQATSYPIAIPREQSRWQGTTVVSMKRENPDWRPTAEMLRENPKLPSWVPGGHPMNPLGVRALYLGSSTYRIHGTDAPWTIGQNVSKGCIRMFNEDVMDLYPKVPTGTKVVVTWERFKTNTIASFDDAPAPGGDAASAPARSGTAVTNSGTPRAKTRSVASAPKAGFFIFPDDEANPVRPEEGMVVHTVTPEGEDIVEEGQEAAKVDAAPLRPKEGMVSTRYGRKVGAGAVSRSAQASVE
jgi:lipoprotein-anchoring transpeptidase ErfK/SrfK